MFMIENIQTDRQTDRHNLSVYISKKKKFKSILKKYT